MSLAPLSCRLSSLILVKFDFPNLTLFHFLLPLIPFNPNSINYDFLTLTPRLLSSLLGGPASLSLYFFSPLSF